MRAMKWAALVGGLIGIACDLIGRVGGIDSFWTTHLVLVVFPPSLLGLGLPPTILADVQLIVANAVVYASAAGLLVIAARNGAIPLWTARAILATGLISWTIWIVSLR